MAVNWGALVITILAASAWVLTIYLADRQWTRRKRSDGIHKRANKGVGGSTGADGAALPGTTPLGANGVAPSPTAGYSRIALTNNTTARAGASTSLSVPVDTVTPLPSGLYAHSVRSVQAPVDINALRAAVGLPPLFAGLNHTFSLTSGQTATSLYGGLTPARAVRAVLGVSESPSPPPLRQMGKLTDYVIGWREWDYDAASGYLVALNRHFGAWRPGQNTAVCRAPSVGIHRSPDAACSCGFHLRYGLAATDGLESALEGTVIGAVRCWGRIIEHPPQGFRAEHVEIVALLDNFGGLASPAAERYAVPVLKYEDLKSYAYEFGRALPGQDAEA